MIKARYFLLTILTFGCSDNDIYYSVFNKCIRKTKKKNRHEELRFADGRCKKAAHKKAKKNCLSKIMFCIAGNRELYQGKNKFVEVTSGEYCKVKMTLCTEAKLLLGIQVCEWYLLTEEARRERNIKYNKRRD